MKKVFPAISIAHSQIVYRYSGVRPLPASSDTNPGFVSRDYRIVPGSLGGKTPLLSLVGGKWTTFRALGEHMANETLQILGVNRKVSTETLAIGGGKDFPRTPQATSEWASAHAGSVSPERAEQLLARYGTYATRVIADLETLGDKPLVHHPGYSVGEITSLVHNESVVTLSDMVHRRTSMAFSGQMSGQLVVELAQVMGPLLGWNASKIKQEIASITVEEGSSQWVLS